ncbi:MAG TPA: Gfo/Idh/MocA family oxidoreductase [Tepidisphaeraceae bacterium]|jgi:predicted dehydrogenase|nr:Gfo/Idh/MocA family oxidoreductase [Tepidisphaeraceae bacterium]
MSDMLNLGIIGFGRIGAEHAGWIGASKTTRVAGVADATPARRELAESRGLRTTADVDELLNDSTVQAVLIAVPTAMHFDLAMRAIAAGKHVMIEKPMAVDFAQSEHLAVEADRRGLMLSVFHNRRWDIDYLTVKDAISSGVLGKLINIESRLGQFASCVGPAAKEYRPNWRNEAAFGGGGLYDWGSHFVDQLWQLLLPARPVRVFAQLRANVWSRDCDDFARVAIDFDNDVAALVEINTTTARPLPRWHLDGALGSASAPHSPAFDTNVWAQLQFTPAEGGQSRALPTARPGLTETMIWDQFAAAVAGGGQPAVLAQSVLTTMQLLDAARASARLGQAVAL